MLIEEGPFTVTIYSEETDREETTEHACLRIALTQGSRTSDGTHARIFNNNGNEICIVDAT